MDRPIYDISDETIKNDLTVQTVYPSNKVDDNQNYH